LLSDPDVAIRVKAAYALAERGDLSGLPVALNASKVPGTCEVLLFLKSGCYPYRDDAIAAVDLMRVRVHPPARMTADAGAMTGLPQSMLESLIQLLLAARDDRTTRDLFGVLHPSVRPEEGDALKDIGEHLDPYELRQLVRALPREAGVDRTALLSGLAKGLKGRAPLDSRVRVDFCDAAKAEARGDLLDAWRGAGHPCASDR
jgi:hypothetical protein